LTETQIAPEDESPVALYARFPRRLRAVLLDSFIIVAILFAGALVISSVASSDAASRNLWIAVVVVAILYEPISVSFAGGTLGHYLTNLRVVDDVTQKRLSFFKAAFRALIKDLLGWLSFFTMTVTRRHQAIHDVLTHSTVQVRDRSRARALHYVIERAPVDAALGMPSRTRRALAITGYIMASYLAVAIVVAILMSEACSLFNRCSRSEHMFETALGIAWLAICGLSIVLGWKGRLWGCRTRARTV
jgi:uncharacterized RDD family membrane protein YckC